MKRNTITLERPERFTTPYTIPKAKLEAAATAAFDMLKDYVVYFCFRTGNFTKYFLVVKIILIQC